MDKITTTRFTNDNFDFDPKIGKDEKVIQNLVGGQWFTVVDDEQFDDEDVCEDIVYIRLDDSEWRCNGFNAVDLQEGELLFFDAHTKVKPLIPTYSY